MQFIYWLISLITPKKAKAETVQVEFKKAATDEDILFDLAKKADIPTDAVRKLIEFRNKKYPESKMRYWAVSDFTLHSSKRRLFVFDVHAREVKSYFVAHGKGSDLNFTGWCKKFSNTPGSKCTSEGVYKCSETYISGKFGLALRLDGLEVTNSNARARAIVFHGAIYAEDAYVKLRGKTGRSEGCQAVGFQYSKELINKLKNGSLLVVWKG